MARLLRRDGIKIEGPLLIWDAPNLQSATYRVKEPWGHSGQMERFSTPTLVKAAKMGDKALKVLGLTGGKE